jgi:hypothetical protein
MIKETLLRTVMNLKKKAKKRGHSWKGLINFSIYGDVTFRSDNKRIVER